jgi:hypothetical protein
MIPVWSLRLAADKTLRTSLQPNQIYVTDEAGTVIKNKYNSARYNDEYANKLHTALNGMVESQMKKQLLPPQVFNTAWVNAGRPDLSSLDAKKHLRLVMLNF